MLAVHCKYCCRILKFRGTQLWKLECKALNDTCWIERSRLWEEGYSWGRKEYSGERKYLNTQSCTISHMLVDPKTFFFCFKISLSFYSGNRSLRPLTWGFSVVLKAHQIRVFCWAFMLSVNEGSSALQRKDPEWLCFLFCAFLFFFNGQSITANICQTSASVFYNLSQGFKQNFLWTLDDRPLRRDLKGTLLTQSLKEGIWSLLWLNIVL